jgi:hypothetical protein
MLIIKKMSIGTDTNNIAMAVLFSYFIYLNGVGCLTPGLTRDEDHTILFLAYT